MRKKLIVAALCILFLLPSCTTAQLAYTSAALDLASDVIDVTLWPYRWRPLPPPPPPMHHHRW